ncbi:piggyBac transposable element-derived protein 4-like [Homalodisca vitripennis]|uniref:piggyBac transposable element-derived protein 4-like n=5 Tax=Homalodisca vitripennis TaxID=197043 RepID=UPI001EECCDD3|nr:piggyBac transposable element-derived protein 4-like [Homalodisca vitripennis]
MARWVDCTTEEIHKFFGVLMIMGICPLPQRQMYWSNNPMYQNSVIKKTMSRDRFDCLLKCLHFQNNEEPATEEPRLWKIKKLLNHLNAKFESLVTPEESLVIDESMVPWRGRLIFKQYLPKKAHKYGVKIYKICTTDGYTLKAKIYAGKSDVTAREAHADKIVMHLMESFLNEGRTLFADNFYNSTRLANTLLEKKTYVCGTLRSDRKGNPKEVTSKKLAKGEVICQESSTGVKVLKWHDKRPVLMITTRPEDVSTLVASKKTTKKGEVVMKPSCVMAYNAAKKGVDFSDQMSSYYTPIRKTLIWYKKVALDLLLGTCVVNALVLHNKYSLNQKNCCMLTFREKILRNLLEGENVGALVQTPQDGRQGTKKLKHVLSKREGTARETRKRCVSCYSKMKEERGAKAARTYAKRVSTYCKGCDETPTMCLECFNSKH